MYDSTNKTQEGRNIMDQEQALLETEIRAQAIYIALKRIIKKCGYYLLAGYLLSVIITALLNYFNFGFDSTDDTLNRVRSGMALRTDHGTGCQYLESYSGSLHPRLSAGGKHIGCQ